MSRRTTRKTEAAPKTAEAKTMISDLKSGKESLPPEVKKEDGPQVEPVAEPPTVGPPPDEAPPEEAQAQPADAPPEAKTEATEAEAEAQSGNNALPQAEATETQRTDGQADQADDEDAQDEDEGDPAFTDQDCQDLPLLEGEVKNGGLVQARAVKEIRQRQLWKSIRNEDGTRRYQTFDDYAEERLGHTRQWVTQQTNWLAMVETLASLRAKGFDVPEFLTPNACNSLIELEKCGHFRGTEAERRKQGLVAVISETTSDGLKLTGANLRTVCERLKDYFGSAGDKKPAAPTYADYRDDCKMLEEVKELQADWNVPGKVVKEQQDSGCSYAEAVGQVYLKDGRRAGNVALLHQATGPDLRAVVDRLLVARKKLEAVEKAKEATTQARQRAKEAKEALEAAKRNAGIQPNRNDGGGSGDGDGGDGDGDGGGGDKDKDEPELGHRWALSMNGNAASTEDEDDLLDRFKGLVESAKAEAKKPGDTVTLTLTLTVEAVAVKDEEPETVEEVIHDGQT